MNNTSRSIRYSIVASMYHSSKYLREFVSRVSDAAVNLVGDAYEIVLVDDGSPDDSLHVALSLQQENDHLRIVELSKNFGHHRAMMTGIEHAIGERIFLLDVDLEEKPEWLGKFDEIIDTEGADLVFGVQKRRNGFNLNNIAGFLFYKIFNLISRVKIPASPVTARVMTRRFADALLLHRERSVLLTGICTLTGFHQVPVFIDKKQTPGTTYTFFKRLDLMISGITSFSAYPLQAMFYGGLIITIFAFAYMIYRLFKYVFFGNVLAGFTSLIMSIWIIGGILILSLGVVGLYLDKIFNEVKNRPYTIIKTIHERKNDEQ